MQVPYTILDVFTKNRLEGNQLAVVFDGDKVPEEQKQLIAKEFNLSETVFLCRPENERHIASLRIFTPGEELPFAGHPTVGAAVLLGLRKHVTAIRLELKVGTIVALTDPESKMVGHARFSLPNLPERLGDAPDIGQLATALGIDEHEIGVAGMVPGLYSAGVPFVVVPVKDEAALSRIKLERRGWQGTFGSFSDKVYAFTYAGEGRLPIFSARAFVEMDGVREDAATGSAAAALCGLLAEQYFAGQEGLIDFIIKQGADMGRPSFIEAQIKTENGEVTHAGIGGHAVVVADGTLFIE